MQPKSLIRECRQTFTAEDFIALVRGDLLALKVPNFASHEVCSKMAANIINSSQVEYYPHAPAIGKIFNAFYEGHSNPEKRQKYYREVWDTAQRFRELAWPFMNPLEQLRLILHDVWPMGAQRESIHGQPMSFGLGQIFREGACALPHMDFLRMDEPQNPIAQTLLTQLTALIYLQPAKAGGNLELWREHYNHKEFEERKNEDTYGLDYTKISQPALSITPQVGDLILADSTRVHAVTHVDKGTRIAVNCFVGFRGINQPLTYWS